jgi:hypothetical protein
MPYAFNPHVGLFPQGFPTKTSLHLSSIHASRPTHFILLDLIVIIIFGEAVMMFLVSPSVTCSFLPLLTKYSPQDPLSILFLNVRNQVSHPYKTAGRIGILRNVTCRGFLRDLKDGFWI